MVQQKEKKKKKAPRAKSEHFDFCSGVLELDGRAAKFSVKEKRFVYAYLTDAGFVANKAAKLAGYDAGSQNAFNVIACALMKRHRIREAINAAMESLTMPKFEVLFRLAEQATGNIADCIGDDGSIDINKAIENGSIKNINQIEITERVLEVKTEAIDKPSDLMNLPAGERGGDNIEKSLIERKYKIKTYSAQNALKILTDVNFAKKHELTGKDGADLPIQPAAVHFYLPDNKRGDAPAALEAKAEGKDKPKKKKDA
jgi:phage terminase small subunit